MIVLINFICLLYILSYFYLNPLLKFSLKKCNKLSKLVPHLKTILLLVLCFFNIYAGVFLFAILLLIDYIFNYISSKYNSDTCLKNKVSFIVFIAKNIISAIIIVITVKVFYDCFNHLEYLENFSFILLITFILSLLITPSSILIENCFKSLGILEQTPKSDSHQSTNISFGKAIGIIERILIFCLLISLSSSYLTIAALLTAKTWARNSDFRVDDGFRLKYILGTFLSILIVILIYLLYDYSKIQL